MACATAEETPAGDGYTAPVAGTGSGGGAGGSATNSAGSLPIAGTTVVPPVAGTTSVGTAGTTAVSGGTGNVAGTGTGGTGVAAGGAATGTCPQYTGTRATDSLIFDGGFGKSTMGTWSGYGYTYKYGTATIAPGTGTSCFAAKKFCANGMVPADDKSGAGLGWNIAQMMGATTQSKVAVTSAVTLKFAGVPGGSRVQLSASSTTSYCYSLTDAEITAGAVTIPAASFKKDCWDAATAVAYDSTVMIEAIQIAVPGSTAGTAKAFDFCVTDIEPG